MKISFREQPSTGKCALCGAPMVERVARRTGHVFLGCSRFPGCTHIIELSDPPHDYDGSLDAVYPTRKLEGEDLWDFPAHDDWGW